MTDLMRCSFVFDNFVDLYRAFSIVKKMANENTSIKGGILRAKDRFNPKEVAFGYRDLLVNLNCPGTGLVCEVQFHHEIFYKYKKDSHYVYKRARLFEMGDRNMAYDYVTEHIKPKIGKNEQYVPRNFDKDQGSDEEGGEEGKTTTKGDEGPKETCEELLKKWLPDKSKKSPDGIIQIDVDGTLTSYLQLLVYTYIVIKQDGFDTVESWEDLTEEDLKGMGFKTGHLRVFLKQKTEYFEGKKKKGEQERLALLDKELQSKEDAKKQEHLRQERELNQKLELEKLKVEQEKLKQEKDKREKEEEYRRLQADRQQQLELEKLRLETERVKAQASNSGDDEKQSKSEAVVKGSDIHFYGEHNDSRQLLVRDEIKCSLAVESINVSCQWKDQGWGNQKSRLYLCIFDSNRKEKKEYDLFNIAPHNWTKVSQTFSATSDIVKNISAGDILQFHRYVGGGGGHEVLLLVFFFLTALAEEMCFYVYGIACALSINRCSLQSLLRL
ncbi:hypothetical protein RFI_04962 [Reticulomyxa filosa]|uniref:SAM domain-containing protein n=1 Tax=Reticulomyxa filosa TaxID=46433 RepID=X6P3K3_RETFI|nr:hypothetical protein RFI_04962 [Reticulomyxa filosa]|eukprot:ETO32152.1 hypothetical protein RFI_04962 [Reticulomyxa filosa]